MARHRFEEIVRYLHFSSNDDPDARRVKTWKIKPVEDAINDSFSRGMTVGPRIAFDEGMIPMRSRFNPMRQYLKAKPHPWGTKCYLTCDSATGYCYRAEIYQGREQSDRRDLLQSENAVVRNIDIVLQGQRNRLIITDRFYTSVLLSSMLLDRGLFHVGTIRTDRLGFCAGIVYKKKESRGHRGSYRIAQSRVFSNMVAVTWMDNKPVYFLATGCSTALTTVGRRDGARVEQIPPPQLVRDYNEGMGGADMHDQKRLQRFSIQRAIVVGLT
ncbi:hypothetical protein ON010_g14608 [Phytophthora cinnamomi]|nr:hypothetical protein ON010_g14608 [Phytophthora cinnamomi]